MDFENDFFDKKEYYMPELIDLARMFNREEEKKSESSENNEISEILEALKELNYDNEISLKLINRLEELLK